MKLFKQNRLRRVAAGLLAAAAAAVWAPPALAENPTYELTSPVALLMEVGNRQVIYQKNMDETMYPASITKIMTALLTMENAELNEVITMSYEATHSIDPGSSHIALDTDEQISVENALYAMMLPSANDAANGLAEYVGGSMDSFVDMMNRRAQELGATGTHFVNPHGLHDAGHYTTAHDIALIACEAVEYEDFCRIWGTMQYDIPPTNKNVERNLWSQVRMLNTDGNYYYENCTGGKLGWTPEAKNTCVIVAEQNGVRLMCVLMGCSLVTDLFEDARYLFDYGFEHLAWQQLQSGAGQNQTVTGYNGSGQEIGQMTLGYDIACLVDSQADAESIRVEWNLPDQPLLGSAEGASVKLVLEEPLGSGQYAELGSYPVSVVNQELFTQEVAAAEEKTEPLGFGGVVRIILKVLLIILGVLAGAFILLYLVVRIRYEVRRRKRRKKRRAMAARGADPKQKTRAEEHASASTGEKKR